MILYSENIVFQGIHVTVLSILKEQSIAALPFKLIWLCIVNY